MQNEQDIEQNHWFSWLSSRRQLPHHATYLLEPLENINALKQNYLIVIA